MQMLREARCSMQVPRAALRAIAVGLLLGTVAACGTGRGGTTASAQPYPVPTSSWAPGDLSLRALARGTLEGGVVRGAYCVWLATNGGQSPIVWPAGYHVRRNPLKLLNSQGAVVASGGDSITVEGGAAPADPGRACMLGRHFAFFVMSNVMARRR